VSNCKFFYLTSSGKSSAFIMAQLERLSSSVGHLTAFIRWNKKDYLIFYARQQVWQRAVIDAASMDEGGMKEWNRKIARALIREIENSGFVSLFRAMTNKHRRCVFDLCDRYLPSLTYYVKKSTNFSHTTTHTTETQQCSLSATVSYLDLHDVHSTPSILMWRNGRHGHARP